MTLLWILLAFISGSIPFSVWIGKMALGKDIRAYGDANPGATNVVRAGGRLYGLLAVLLDGLKGLVPVYFVLSQPEIEAYGLVLVALAPVAGHAFSPLLRGRGGKAVAVTLGIWTGLLGWSMPFILGLSLLIGYLIIDIDGWSVLFMFGILALFLTVTAEPMPIFLIWTGNLLIVGFKHRKELRARPRLRFHPMRGR